MTEDLGTPTRPHALTGEQWRLEVRTDDPPSPSADERWIRSDLDGGDRVATLKCGDGSEIPLFPTGTAEETVREARRYRVGGQTVYAPLAPVDEAAYPSRRVQHDGQTHAFHNRVSPGVAIPDSVVYDFETGDTSRWDTVNDLSAVTQPFNGSFSGRCDTAAAAGDPQAAVIPTDYNGGEKPERFEFFWNETFNHSGGGIRLVNSNGNVEVGLLNEQPQWSIDDETGVNQVSSGGNTGGSYDGSRWRRFSITIDWDTGTFDPDFEHLGDGTTFTDTGRPLKNGTDIETVQIDEYSSSWQSGHSIDMWFDNIGLYKTA